MAVPLHLENLLLNGAQLRYHKVWAFKIHADIKGFVAGNSTLNDYCSHFVSFRHPLFREFQCILKSHRPCLEEVDDF